MSKRKFIAFWDVVFLSIITAIMLTCALIIMLLGFFESFDSIIKNWYYVVIFAFCISIPVVLIMFIQRVTIDLNCDKADFFYLVNYEKNERDLDTNWIIYPSQIEKISVVKLTKEEKRKYTSARFLFSKYLKIEMEYGNIKYIYISHYSKFQIKKIIKMLTSKNK